MQDKKPTGNVSDTICYVGILYHISLVIRQSFSSKNNLKNVDPSYKTDLDVLDRLGRVNLYDSKIS